MFTKENTVTSNWSLIIYLTNYSSKLRENSLFTLHTKKNGKKNTMHIDEESSLLLNCDSGFEENENTRLHLRIFYNNYS